MKRLFLLLMLPLLAITFNSCSKDNDEGDVVYNKLTIDGKAYESIAGDYNYSSEDNSLLLSIETKEGVYIDFDYMFIPSGNTKLVAGTYKYAKTNAPFTFSYGELYDDAIGYEKEITGGTVIVAVSGNIYTIEMNCTLGGGGTLKGTYKGELTLHKEFE